MPTNRFEAEAIGMSTRTLQRCEHPDTESEHVGKCDLFTSFCGRYLWASLFSISCTGEERTGRSFDVNTLASAELELFR